MTHLALYQRVHICGMQPRFVRQHLALLSHLVPQLFGRSYNPDVEKMTERLVAVAVDAGYPKSYSSFVDISLTVEGEELQPSGVSLYEGYVLRYVKPRAVTLECEPPLGCVPTSAREAVQQLADLQARARGGDVAVCCDRSGRMLMADNAPLFGIRAKELFAGEALHSVERSRLLAMAASLDLNCSAEPLTRQMVERLDELFYVDHRGVTAFSSCDSHPLMSLRAERIAKAMELSFLKK